MSKPSASRTPKRRRRLTPKQRVLKHFPMASAEQFDYFGSVRWRVWLGDRGFPRDSGNTAAEAWASAAGRIA